MKKFVLVPVVALGLALVAGVVSPSFAQVTSTSTGGAGGSGGSAAGGMATGGTSTNTNTTTGGTANSTGGTSSAAGGSSNIGSATSNSQAADVSVNYITPAGAAGVNGLAPGVDPSNNHVVSDNNVHYSGTTKIKNTADISIGGPASGPCNGASGGLGVSVPGVAVGANVSTVDKGCEARETARVAAMLGRMDVANAILENMDVVVSALRARSARDAQAAADVERTAAQARAAAAANAAVAEAVRSTESERAARDREAQAMRVQQEAGMAAIARQATMAKVYDTLSFTGKLTQGEEKTPQQVMAEELAAKQATEKAASTTVPGGEAAATLQSLPPQVTPQPAPQQPMQAQDQPRPASPLAQPPAGQRQPRRSQPVDDTTAQRIPDQAAVDRKATQRPVAARGDAAAPPLIAAARPADAAAKPTAPTPHREPGDGKRGAKPDDADDAVRFALGIDR